MVTIQICCCLRLCPYCNVPKTLLMSAGEGEYVAFAEECSCDGPVESWLQNVVDAMRAALSHEFKVAIPAYDEKPRTKWIFDYSVQNTIMVSRTFFTQDVNEAFEELEEGNEDALKVCPSTAAQHAAASDLGFTADSRCVAPAYGF